MLNSDPPPPPFEVGDNLSKGVVVLECLTNGIV